jgi:hypothetical protein
MARLTVEYGGVTFRNPIVAAAGPAEGDDRTHQAHRPRPRLPGDRKHNGPIFHRSARTFTGLGVKSFHVTEGPQFHGTVVDIDPRRTTL